MMTINEQNFSRSVLNQGFKFEIIGGTVKLMKKEYEIVELSKGYIVLFDTKTNKKYYFYCTNTFNSFFHKPIKLK